MTRRIALVLLACATLLAACGDDDVGLDGDRVGGACQDDRDCQYRCEDGDEFPNGTCTQPCNIDDDCPIGTYCIDRDDGICLLGCEHPDDCRRDYTCEGRENRGHGGDSLVCVRD